MNLSSPTYMPTWVTPDPGAAEKSKMSPGRSASMTGATSAPAEARPPLEAAAHAPLSGELLRGRIRGKAQRDAGECVRPERAAAAERLQLVGQPVEGAAAAQRVVEDHLRPEAVRERPAPARAGAEFVAVRAVTVVPAAAVELPVATLGGEHRRNAEREREPPELSRPPQPPCTPATAGAPCDATGGAEAGA